MTRGRKKTPTTLQLLRGNPGKRAVNGQEPAPRPAPPPKPAHLDAIAGETWDRIAPELERLGVLTVIDGPALELLVCAYAEWRDARAVVAEEGMTYETEGESGVMYRARPEVAIAADAYRRVCALLAEFGLTPSGRAKLKVEAPATADPMDAFLSRAAGGGTAAPSAAAAPADPAPKTSAKRSRARRS